MYNFFKFKIIGTSYLKYPISTYISKQWEPGYSTVFDAFYIWQKKRGNYGYWYPHAPTFYLQTSKEGKMMGTGCFQN